MSVAITALPQPSRWAFRAMRIHHIGSPPIGAGVNLLSAMQWHVDHRHHAPMDALPFATDDRWLVSWLAARKHVPGLVHVGARTTRDHVDIPYYAVADGHTLTPDDLSLGLSQLTELAFAAHEHLIGDDIPNRLQVSVPNALDLAYHVSGSIEAAAEWMPAMQAVVAHEVAEISSRWGQLVRLQLESPAILLAYHQTELQDWPLLTSEIVQQVAGILNAAPAADWVLHVCAGLVEQTNIAAAVTFLNAMADLLTNLDQPMPTVHLPVIHDDVPPPTDPEFYTALRRLRRGINVVAGVVAESYPEQTRIAVDLAVDALSSPPAGVGAGCGLRDRTAEAGAANAALAASVALAWAMTSNQ
jgi:hypothetical protein